MRPPSSSSSSSSTATAAVLLATATSKLLRSSVEWNPTVASYLFRNTTAAPATGTSSSQSSSSSSSSFSYFVLPDLPELRITNTDAQDEFCRTITNLKQRIITIATCHHSARSLLHTVASPTMAPGTTLLLVGGNTKNGHTTKDTNWKTTTTSLSSLAAAQLLTQERETVPTYYPVWGVMNPNDPKSVDVLAQKITAGMTGFITQPGFTSDATDTLYRYRDCCDSHTNNNNNNNRIPILAGVACPKTLRGLQFWSKLVAGHDEELMTLFTQDPVFQRHVWYFSQPSVPSLAWSRRELHDLVVQHSAVLDGIHFMPLQNTEDFGALLPLFHQLNRHQQQQPQ